MGSKANDLHLLFFPFMVQGHMLPLVDMAKLFVDRGARITILTTPINAAITCPTIDDSVHLHIISFPSLEFGLPKGCENLTYILPLTCTLISSKPLPRSVSLLTLCLETLAPTALSQTCSCGGRIMLPPREVYHDLSSMAPATFHVVPWMLNYERCRLLVAGEAESFVLPGLPHHIEMLRTQVMDKNKLAGTPNEFMLEMHKEIAEVEPKCYGMLMNSFYELEPEYVDHYCKVMGRMAWNVGPVSLCNHEVTYKLVRGGEQTQASCECLKWLDKKPMGSIVYMCFGSAALFSVSQLKEMALGLEASKHSFIWVVLNGDNNWVPESYEERIKGRRMVIRGWAPQLLILNHTAIGGFVTHCGWNSSLEGICARLPMLTWPLYAEQFYNEKLLVEVLKVGIEVGSKVYDFNSETRPILRASIIETAVRNLMGEGEEADERSRRAKVLGENARRAIQKGGSSYNEIEKLMQEMINQRKHV